MNNIIRFSCVVFFCLCISNATYCQDINQTKSLVDELNRKIDKAVVKRDMDALRQWYADDFVFTHGTGLVDSKESWLKNVQNPDMRYISREHDSTQVELHGDIAIITGKLSIVREDKRGVSKYGVRYVRVYALRNKNWQFISHRSTLQWKD